MFIERAEVKIISDIDDFGKGQTEKDIYIRKPSVKIDNELIGEKYKKLVPWAGKRPE